MKRTIKVLVKISFIFYLFILFYLIFLRHRWSWQNVSILEFALARMNLIPFKTIGGYIAAFFEGSMNSYIPLTNLLGNMLMFLPMGIYLPLLFRKIDTVKKCLLINVAFLFIIEVLQILTRRGSFDIDDFILNILGILFGYAIWKSKEGQLLKK